MSRIAKRYARALFNLTAGDLGKARKERDTLVALKELFDQKDAGKVLRSPVMPKDLKRELLDYGLKQTGGTPDTTNLVHAVLAAGRVHLLPAVADAFSELIDGIEGIARAQVTAAVALDQNDQKDIAEALGRILSKKIEITQAVDPALLGGFVAKVGHYQVDLSLRTKLDGLAASAVQDTVR